MAGVFVAVKLRVPTLRLHLHKPRDGPRPGQRAMRVEGAGALSSAAGVAALKRPSILGSELSSSSNANLGSTIAGASERPPPGAASVVSPEVLF